MKKLLVQFELTLDSKKKGVRYEVLQQDESLRGKQYLGSSSSDRLHLVSNNNPALSESHIYLRGMIKNQDGRITSINEFFLNPFGRFKSIEEYVEDMLSAFSALGRLQGHLEPDKPCTFTVWKRER